MIIAEHCAKLIRCAEALKALDPEKDQILVGLILNYVRNPDNRIKDVAPLESSKPAEKVLPDGAPISVEEQTAPSVDNRMLSQVPYKGKWFVPFTHFGEVDYAIHINKRVQEVYKDDVSASALTMGSYGLIHNMGLRTVVRMFRDLGLIEFKNKNASTYKTTPYGESLDVFTKESILSKNGRRQTVTFPGTVRIKRCSVLKLDRVIQQKLSQFHKESATNE